MEQYKGNTKGLFTCNFFFVAAGNFFLFLSFYALMPLLPFYLTSHFSADGTATGAVLSVYIVSCILIRPFYGYLLDTFSRRPVYVIAYLSFASIFSIYIFCASLWLFILMRVLHGAAFGGATVSGGTIVTQVIPKSRLGEGIGYYGLANTMSMCFGPLLGLYAHNYLSFTNIFIGLTFTALIGTAMASLVRIPVRTHQVRKTISVESFFIKSAFPIAIIQILAYVTYGATTSYIAVFAVQNMIGGYSGWYFTCMAVGLGLSRPFAGKKVDKGNLSRLVVFGIIMTILVGISLFRLNCLPVNSRPLVFLIVAFLQGIGYGILHPSLNTIFIRQTDEAHRGAATSMFFTSNDLGIGLGVLAGGIADQYFGGYFSIFGIGAACGLISLIAFHLKS